MSQLKNTLIHIIGWIFLIVGVAGLFLPLLQGLLFIVIGFYLLSRSSVWFETKLNALKIKHPKLADHIIKIEIMVEQAIEKIKVFFSNLFK